MFDQRGELPLLPFGNPIGFVPASIGGVYSELNAGVVKLVDALDSKSSRGNPVGVRLPPPAPPIINNLDNAPTIFTRQKRLTLTKL